MKQFNTIEELAQAYTSTHNSETPEHKHFTIQAVMNVCLESMTRISARIKHGIEIPPRHQMVFIRGFGYAVAPNSLDVYANQPHRKG
jgi:hypothetical protein